MRTANAGCHGPRAIGYLRVSTNRQAENGYGLEAQRDQVEQFCAANGLELVGLPVCAANSTANAYTWLHEPARSDVEIDPPKRQQLRPTQSRGDEDRDRAGEITPHGGDAYRRSWPTDRETPSCKAAGGLGEPRHQN
jgi:hypothetical protein